MKVKTNLIGGVIFIILGLILLLLQPSQVIVSNNIAFLESAKVAPMMSIIVMFFGGIFLIFQSLVLKKEKEIFLKFQEQKNALYMALYMLLYAATIYFLGFLIASAALIVLLFMFYKNKNKKHLIAVFIIAALVYVLFTRIFNVSLPGIGGVVNYG